MKRIFIIIFLSFFLKANDLDMMNLDTSFKKVTIQKVELKMLKDSLIDKDIEEDEWQKIEDLKDSDKQEISYIEFDEAGYKILEKKDLDLFKYEYDNNYNLISILKEDDKEVIQEKIQYEYRDDFLTKEIKYDKDGKIVSIKENTYKGANLLSTNNYSAYGYINNIIYYEYDEDNNLIKEYLKKKNSNKTLTKEYKYKKGKLLTELYYDNFNEITQKDFYKYDKSDNLIEKYIFDYTYGSSKMPNKILEYKNNNITKETINDIENKKISKIFIYDYDDDKIILKEEYDGLNNLIKIQEYNYKDGILMENTVKSSLDLLVSKDKIEFKNTDQGVIKIESSYILSFNKERLIKKTIYFYNR